MTYGSVLINHSESAACVQFEEARLISNLNGDKNLLLTVYDKLYRVSEVGTRQAETMFPEVELAGKSKDADASERYEKGKSPHRGYSMVIK